METRNLTPDIVRELVKKNLNLEFGYRPEQKQGESTLLIPPASSSVAARKRKTVLGLYILQSWEERKVTESFLVSWCSTFDKIWRLP